MPAINFETMFILFFFAMAVASMCFVLMVALDTDGKYSKYKIETGTPSSEYPDDPSR